MNIINCAILLRALSLLLALLVSGCGFHLRGSLTQLTDLGSIYVDAERNLSIADTVKVALAETGFSIASNRMEADITLLLCDEEQRERVVSVRSTGRVSELELSHAVKMRISQTADERCKNEKSAAQKANRVEVIREYTYDETGVLAKENEARILRKEMTTELVRQIVLRTIASLAPLISSLSVNHTQWPLTALNSQYIGSHLSS